MADYYVWSGATGAANGSSWADAYTSLISALAGATGAGPHNLLVDNGLTQSVTSATLALDAATSGATINIISVDRGGRTTGTAHDGYKAGAAISVGTNAFAVTIATARSQVLNIFGLTITGNSGNSASNTFGIANTATASLNITLRMDSCTLSCPGSSGSAVFLVGSIVATNITANNISLRNCSFALPNRATGSGIQLQQARVSANGITISYAGANKPTSLFTSNAQSSAGVYDFRDSDLSGFNTSGGNYVLLTNMAQQLTFTNCKLSSTPGLSTGTWPSDTGNIAWINTDSADTRIYYRLENQLGTLTHDATYYRSNGAKMWAAGIGWKLVTTSSCGESKPFQIWLRRSLSASGSSTTFGVEVLRASSLPTDREMWLQVSTVNDASFPLGTLASTRNASPFIGTGSTLTSSSEAWAGSLSGGVTGKMAITTTPSELSLIEARVMYGVASSTIYLDPCVTISGQTDGPSVYWQPTGVFNAEPAAASGGAYLLSRSGMLGGG